MELFGSTAGKRARQELQEQLRGISDRLDQLETTPTPSITEENLQLALEQLLKRLGERFEVVDARIDGLDSKLLDGERRVKALTFAVEEGVERVSRTERRIHATIKRARKELQSRGFEDPGLEAEAEELRSVDGAGGGESEVSPLPEGVARIEEAPSSIKGVPAQTLARVRGF